MIRNKTNPAARRPQSLIIRRRKYLSTLLAVASFYAFTYAMLPIIPAKADGESRRKVRAAVQRRKLENQPVSALVSRILDLEERVTLLEESHYELIAAMQSQADALGGFASRGTIFDEPSKGRQPPRKEARREAKQDRPDVAYDGKNRCEGIASSTGKRCKLRATGQNGRCRYHAQN